MIKHGVTANNIDHLKTGTFKVLGQGYWWNMQQGCQCPALSQFAESSHQACTIDMINVNCRQVHPSDEAMRMLPIVNGK